MEIKRHIYLQRLIDRRLNRMVKIITGVRRCGKSYLLFNLYYNWLKEQGISDNHIITINLEDIENRELRDPMTLYKTVMARVVDEQIHYIMLDEVQMVSGFEDVLNGFLNKKNLDVYVTGSNAKYLSNDVITEFRGRGDEVRVRPLSFSEYMQGSEDHRTTAFADYMLYGGLPQILLFKTEEQKITFLKNLFRETYIKDIKNRHNLRADMEMDNLVDILASSIGSLTNPATIANTFKSLYHSSVDAKTVKTYIDHLINAFILERAKRFDVKGRRYIDTPYKYYLVDTGLRNARLGFSLNDPGHLMENIIYNELRMRGFDVDVGFVPVQKRDNEGNLKRSQLEVDFVCSLGSRRYYIQSSYKMIDQDKIQQEMASLSHIDDTFKKIIIIGDDMGVRRTSYGITIISIYDFLLKENSLEL